MTQNNLALNTNPDMPEKYSEVIPEITQDNSQKQDATNQETTQVIVDDKVITISRERLQEELDRLRREDNEFAQVYNRDIGNKAALRYKPQIDLLQKQNEALALALKKLEYGALTQEEVNNRFKTDSKFAEDYAKVSHAEVPQVESNFNPQEMLASIETVRSFSLRVLSSEQQAIIQKNIDAEKYDKDENGNPYDQFTWREGLDRWQEDIVALTRNNQSSNGTTPTPTNQPVTQVKVDTARPDMSNNRITPNNQAKFTIQQVREMPWEEQFKRWPEGYEKAVENGEIIIPGYNDR